jgi:hypothetical protein
MGPLRLVGSGLAVVLLLSTAAGAGTPIPVRTTRAIERFPAADEDYVAWSQVQRRKQNVFVQPSGQTPFRVNPSGVQAATGGIDGDQLVYQEYVPRRNKSDLKMMDLTTKDRSNPPAGINTRRWEYWPDMSGDYILFGRLFRSGDRQIVLFDQASDTASVLAQTSGWNRMLTPGKVSGDYVAWDKIRYRRGRLVDCEVFVRNLTTGTTTLIPNSGDRCQFGASVSEDGTAYYGRSGYGCGLSSRLVAYPIGGPATTLVEFPQGKDISETYVFTATNNDDHVFFDRASCSRPRQDIFKVEVP